MTTYAAHIVTSEAHPGLGDPEIIVMTSDEGMGAQLIERIFLLKTSLTDALDVLEDRGYRLPRHPTEIETGYWIIDAERG